MQAVDEAVTRLSGRASLVEVERAAIDAVKRRALAFNGKRPEVICIAYEHDPRDAHMAGVAEARAREAREADARAGEWTGDVLLGQRRDGEGLCGGVEVGAGRQR